MIWNLLDKQFKIFVWVWKGEGVSSQITYTFDIDPNFKKNLCYHI